VTVRIPQISPWLDEEAAEAVAAVVRSGWITEGPATHDFGERLNALIGVPYGVFAPNGTLALTLGLLALGIGPGDEVLVPDITFIGSASAIILAGATPVFTEVDGQCFQIDVERARDRLTPRTKAVMPVHLFGTACNMHDLRRFVSEHGLAMIEDAAQGIGVTFDGRHVGSFGDVGCFSFFADKTITTGEGGYVACRDDGIYERLRLLRNQGRLDRGSFVHPSIGFNFRLTDLQSALGLVQLNRLPRIIERKTAIIGQYRERLAAVPEVRLLGAAPEANHVPFRCVLIVDQPHALMDYLAERGIQPRSSFYPLHRQPSLKESSHGRISSDLFDDGKYPNAIFSWDHGVCLPVHPTLTDDEVDIICGAVIRFIRQ
jgi:perosamine synthetase